MIIGERLKQIRESKNLSQGDIEHQTGLLRCYISRVENGHTVPAIETLEKMARALDVPMYQLFYDGTEAKPLKTSTKSEVKLDRKSKVALQRITKNLPLLTARDRSLLVTMSEKLAR